MKCKHAQKTLLATSGRRKLSTEVQEHVAECARCRQWKTKLTAIDRGVFLIPTPSGTDAKNAFLAEFLHEPVIEPSPGWKLKLPGTRWQQALAGIAAAVVLVLAFSGVLKRERNIPVASSSQTDPLLAKVMERNLTLATADSATKRVQTLSDLADDLDSQTRQLALVAHADDLQTLAKLYDEVLKTGIVKQAGEVRLEDRQNVLKPIADRLLIASRQMRQDAIEMPNNAEPLKQMAQAADEANQKLRILIKKTEVAAQEANPSRPEAGG
jgi:ABC-type transporter Mla MlaB component